MLPETQALLDKAKQLPADEQLALARGLLVTDESEPDGRAWLDELDRRLEEIERGEYVREDFRGVIEELRRERYQRHAP